LGQCPSPIASSGRPATDAAPVRANRKRSDLRHWLAPLHPLLLIGLVFALGAFGKLGVVLFFPVLFGATFIVIGFSDRRGTVLVVGILTVLLLLAGYGVRYLHPTCASNPEQAYCLDGD
jgi:hypothetical protein